MERILRNVLEGSLTTFCAASSQLLGDSESTSITFTILGMSLISFLLDFARRHEYGRKVRAGLARLARPTNPHSKQVGAEVDRPLRGRCRKINAALPPLLRLCCDLLDSL